MDAENALLNYLALGLAACEAVIRDDGGLLAALFLAGLGGSLSHCAGMCGPFVLAQTTARLEAVPAAAMSEFQRLKGAALVPYHLGRGTTYCALGAVAGATAGASVLDRLPWLAPLLLGVAALFFLLYGLTKLGMRLPRLPGRDQGQGSGDGWLARAARPLFGHPIGFRGYALGLVLGFLPCGLLWGGLAAAGGTGDALAGAFAMAAFTAGTVPALLAVGYAGGTVIGRTRERLTKWAPWLLILNAGLLILLASRALP